MTLQYKRELEPKEILDQAISQGLTDFYVAYSGGKDSGIVLDIVAKNYPDNFRGVVFVNTGIATDATISFVKDYCSKRAYPLYVLNPNSVKRKKDGNGMLKGQAFTYENLVLRYGFPSASSHNPTMAWLKYYPLRQFVKNSIANNEKPAIISGVRKNESKRRSKKYSDFINKDHNLIFVCPIFYKSNDWVMRYFIENDIKRSPVYDTLHISGDCLCGSFAQKNELKLLEMFHPKTFTEIKRLEKLLKAKGTGYAKKYSTWGNHKQTTDNIKAQTTIESYLCSDCILDRSATDDDTKRFNDEMEDIEAKLDKL